MNKIFLHSYGATSLNPLTYVKTSLNHVFNPLHVYARLLDCKVNRSMAGKIIKGYELYVYNPLRGV